MTRDHFYVTLPSNSSMAFFPENRTSRYMTQLPRTIELTGEWEVGLAEIHFPLTFENNASDVRVPACQMFVYCDLLEPRIVGDVHAPLLRVVQACGKRHSIQGESEIITFSPPHYLPLLLTNFRTIEMDIRDHAGRTVPFANGTLTVTLHFRRAR